MWWRWVCNKNINIIKIIFIYFFFPSWRVDDVSNPEADVEVYHILTHLKPYTQYAFYVKTYTIATERSGAQSPINYFRTLPDGTLFVSFLFSTLIQLLFYSNLCYNLNPVSSKISIHFSNKLMCF